MRAYLGLLKERLDIVQPVLLSWGVYIDVRTAEQHRAPYVARLHPDLVRIPVPGMPARLQQLGAVQLLACIPRTVT